jgi:hypothetical protein
MVAARIAATEVSYATIGQVSIPVVRYFSALKKIGLLSKM